MTGNHVLNRLLDEGGFDPIVALLRTPMHRAHPRLRERIVSFDDLNTLEPIPLELAVCCLGTTLRQAGSKEAFRAVDHGYVLTFAKWALAGGASHFLYQSSVGADPESNSFYLRVKGETERDLAALDFHRVDIFQPSILLGQRTESRPLERIGQFVANTVEWAMVGPLERYRGIQATVVAAAIAHCAKEHKHAGIFRWDWRGMMELSR